MNSDQQHAFNTTQLPNPYSTAEDLDKAVNSVEFAARPWMAAGIVTMILSTPGLGKTPIALDVGRRFLNPDLGWFDGQPLDIPPDKPIIWCDTEGFQGALKDRFNALGIPKDRVILPFRDPLDEIRLDRGGHLWQLQRVIILAQPSLLVVDSLRGSHLRDGHYSKMQRLLHGLMKLVQKYNLFCLVTHHTNKPRPGTPDVIDSINRIRGSSAIGAQCRIVWALDDPDPNSDYKRLNIIRNNLEPKIDPLGVRITDSGVEWNPTAPKAHVTTRKKKEDEAGEFIRKALEKGPRAAREIKAEAEQRGISKSSLDRASKGWINKDKEKGKQHGGWIWSLRCASFNPDDFVEEE